MSSGKTKRSVQWLGTVLCGAVLVLPMAAQNGTAAGSQDGPPMTNGGPPPPPPGDPGRRMESMERQLDLTPQQSAQIRPIMVEAGSRLQALRANTALSPEDRRAQMMALHQEEVSKVRAILTPEQQAKFDAMQQRMRDRMREQRQGGTPPPPPPSGTPQP